MKIAANSTFWMEPAIQKPTDKPGYVDIHV